MWARCILTTIHSTHGLNTQRKSRVVCACGVMLSKEGSVLQRRKLPPNTIEMQETRHYLRLYLQHYPSWCSGLYLVRRTFCCLTDSVGYICCMQRCVALQKGSHLLDVSLTVGTNYYFYYQLIFSLIHLTFIE